MKAKIEVDGKFLFFITLAILLCYGFELFGFHLTIDEEIHAANPNQWAEWAAQGRWGMAFLNSLVLPNPIVPAVSTFIGVLGITFGIAQFSKKLVPNNSNEHLVVVAVAITIPTFAFTLTFSTLAYGIGIAFISIAIAEFFLNSEKFSSIIFAAIFSAFAVSIYQTFIFVVLTLLISRIFILFETPSPGKSKIITKLLLFFVLCLLVYYSVNFLTLKIFGLETKYVTQFVDLQGLLNNPTERLSQSFHRIWEISRLVKEKFGNSSIWLVVLISWSIFSLTYYSFERQAGRKNIWRLLAIGIIFLIFVLADSVVENGAPLRSIVYFPVGVAILLALTFSISGKINKRFLYTFCILSIIGNSQISNHLFESSVSAETKDRFFAQKIIDEIYKIKPEYSSYAILKVEVIGGRTYPASGIQSKAETFGASFFEWDGGNRHRVAAYLRLNGIAAISATEEERVEIYRISESMPSWPRSGWVKIFNDKLILNLGPYSDNQKNSLCADGVKELCRL